VSGVRFREEVLNVNLAQILRRYGLTANPEIITSGKLPDVRIVAGGLKVILEGKNETQRKVLEKQARKRLEHGLADISIAIYYPNGLNEAENLDALKDKMLETRYSGVVYHWSTTGINQIRLDRKMVGDLVEILNHVFTLYTTNDLLTNKIKEIEAGITKLTGEGQQTSLLFNTEAVKGKLRKALGIGEEEDSEEEE
jgi:hypothetical protein